MGQNFSSEPVVEKETERDHNDTFNVAVSSCQGWRMSQEDNHSMILDLPGQHKASFFAVYDGHGSARVSKHASEGLWRHLTENEMYIKGNFKEALEGAFLTFDREVNESYNAQLAGTTAVCILIVDNIIYCANIGDSRAVASVNCECIPLSHDHKPENPQELKRILNAGGYVLGNRVNGNLALSRAFGDFHYKGNDQLPPEQQIVSPCPDVKRIELNDDVDFIVLACDGIWDVLSSEEVVKFVISCLEKNMEPGLICEQLTTRCLATDYELVIGCDNMTVLLVCYTRGRSWTDYCSDIFNKNSEKMGVSRPRTFTDIRGLNRERQQEQQNSTSDYMQDTSSATTTTVDDIQNEPSGGNNLSNSLSQSLGSTEMRMLLNFLGTEDHESENSDDTPPVTEVQTEETETIGEGPTDKSDTQEIKISNETDDHQQKESSDSNDLLADSQEEKSSNVTEIQLSSPDEEDASTTETPVMSKEDKGDDSKTDRTEVTQEELSSNTIEMQLSSPDKEEDGANETQESQKEAECKNPIGDEDANTCPIISEEPPEQSGMAEEEKQEETEQPGSNNDLDDGGGGQNDED